MQLFVLAQLVFSGLPIMTFFVFSTTVLLSAIATCLTVALITALTFTSICVGGALFLFVPTMFVTTFMATSLFFWGIVGYKAMQLVNAVRSKAPTARDVERSFQSSITELEKDTSALERVVSDNLTNGETKLKRSGVEIPATPTRKREQSQPSSSAQKPPAPGKPSTAVHSDDNNDPALKDKWTTYLEQAERSVKPQPNAAARSVSAAADSVKDQVSSTMQSGKWTGEASDASMTTAHDNKENLTEAIDGVMIKNEPPTFGLSLNTQQQRGAYHPAEQLYTS